jgi:hypothetical protein
MRNAGKVSSQKLTLLGRPGGLAAWRLYLAQPFFLAGRQLCKACYRTTGAVEA